MKLPVKTRAITFTCRGEGINSNDGQWAPYFYAATTLESALKFARDFNARADYRNMVATALVCLEGIPITTEEEVAVLTGMEWSAASVLHIESDEEFKHLSEQFDAQRKQIEELEDRVAHHIKRLKEMKDDRDSYRRMFDEAQQHRATLLTKLHETQDWLNGLIEQEENRD